MKRREEDRYEVNAIQHTENEMKTEKRKSTIGSVLANMADKSLLAAAAFAPAGAGTMRTKVLAAVVVVMVSLSSASGGIVVKYNGNGVVTPSETGTDITASNLTFSSKETDRIAWGAAGSTPAGPIAGTSSGSEWSLFRASNIPTGTEPGAESQARMAFTIEYTGTGSLTLGNLKYDWALATDGTTGMEGYAAVFARKNAEGFSSFGSVANISLANVGPVFSPVSTTTVDISGLGALSSGDTAEIRIAFQNNSNLAGKGLFTQGVQLEIIPEPASGALFVLASGLLWFVRRKLRA